MPHPCGVRKGSGAAARRGFPSPRSPRPCTRRLARRVTQFPAGVGVRDASELKPDLVDACENLRMGTKMFAKIMRIVAKWYGSPTSKEVLPQIFEDAVYSWRTGEFEGASVFQAEEPETSWTMPQMAKPAGDEPDQATEGSDNDRDDADPGPRDEEQPKEQAEEKDTGKAGIRIDLTRINGK